MTLSLVKLCVGCDTVDDLLEWWRARGGGDAPWKMHTRQTPKRAEELIEGGSLYRVYRGFILSRQAILAVDTVGEGVARHCEVTLSHDVVLVEPTPRRAFQGWRYLERKDAPKDLGSVSPEAAPPELARRLKEIGAW